MQELGDVTWHAGWTLHFAPPAPDDMPIRLALAVSYFADGATVLPCDLENSEGFEMLRYPHNEDTESFDNWLYDLEPGNFAEHPSLPLVWSGDE